MMRYVPHILFGLLVFILLYLEPLSIGGLKISHLWKLAVLYLLGLAILMSLTRRSRMKRLEGFAPSESLRYGYLFVVWTLVSSLFHSGGLSSSILATQRLFPLMFLHYLLLQSFEPQKYYRALIATVVFIALSALPFQLHLFEPLGTGYDVVALLDAERPGFVGIFQNQHVASLTLSLAALLSVLFTLDGSRHRQRLVAALLSTFLIFTLLTTYARSGYAALIIGIIVYLVVSGRAATAFKMVVLGICFFLVVYTLFPEIDVLRDRLLGKTRYSDSASLKISSVGSGRTNFWKTALKIYAEQSPGAQLVGIGGVAFEENMYMRLGHRIYAHNGFINNLLLGGAGGLFFFLLFLKGIYSDIKKINDSFIRNSGLAIFFAWLTFVFFQGGEFPLQTLLLFLFIAISISQQRINGNRSLTNKALFGA